ncbi:MAG: UDP-N-acetylmuramoyl-tripeptide--D-alanyl-D-alanine ligase [Oscillospiraceae bacterium]
MEKLSLKCLAGAINASSESDVLVNSVCIDTRKIEKGCLFVAIKGDNFDGHDFIEKAFELGVAGVVSQNPVPNHDEVILVNDTRKALLDLAAYYRSLFNIFTVGVTGSVGKTSTKEMIYAILSEKGDTLKTEGNFNNEIGMPLTMFRLDQSFKNAVFEMGMSSFGEISALTKVCKPNVGVITNIGVSHIEILGSRENIRKAKLEIIDGMTYDAPLVLNADDDMLSTINNEYDHPVVYYGIETPADITASDIKQIKNSTEFLINYYGKSIKAIIPTIGKHNIYNALAGFCVGLIAEMEPDDIVRGMKFYKNSGLRQNTSTVNGIKLVADCYNASPDSMVAALDVITNIECTGKRICVLGDMLELGEFSSDAHIEVGKAVARTSVDTLICYGDEAKNIKRGAMMVGMKNVLHFDDKQNISDYLIKNAQQGDAIIFKASRGMKLEEVIIQLNKEWQND